MCGPFAKTVAPNSPSVSVPHDAGVEHDFAGRDFVSNHLLFKHTALYCAVHRTTAATTAASFKAEIWQLKCKFCPACKGSRKQRQAGIDLVAAY